MFANLGIAKAQSRLLSLNFNFANQLWRCHNPLVRLVTEIHLVLLTISLLNRSCIFCFWVYYAMDIRCLK